MLNLNRDIWGALDDYEVFLELEHDPQVMLMNYIADNLRLSKEMQQC